MSGIHLVTRAFIVNKITHLLCPVVSSRQGIDLWIAIQNSARRPRGRGTEQCLWRLLDVACDGDKHCSLVILHYTNHLSTVYWISYYKEPILRARRVAHRVLSGPNNIRMMHGRRPSKVYSWRIRGGNVKDISADTLPTKSLLRRELCGKTPPQQPGEKTLTNTFPFQTFTISGEECSLLWLQTITTVAPEINEKKIKITSFLNCASCRIDTVD